MRQFAVHGTPPGLHYVGDQPAGNGKQAGSSTHLTAGWVPPGLEQVQHPGWGVVFAVGVRCRVELQGSEIQSRCTVGERWGEGVSVKYSRDTSQVVRTAMDRKHTGECRVNLHVF